MGRAGRSGRRGFGRAGGLVGAACALIAGCAWDDWSLSKTPDTPPGPADSLVLRGDKVEADKTAGQEAGVRQLAGANELYRRGDYALAEKVFRKVADNKHNTPQVAEEARYYEAECLRLQKRYPKASDVYTQLLTDFPNGMHREQAVERKFEIANVWLDDTREDMKAHKEKEEGKRSLVMPAAFVHFEKEKPFFDEEGRAIEALDQVTLSDFNGRRADEALFLAGSVKFYREDYREADRYFSQIVEMHPNSKLAPQAVELAIIAKNLETGGPDYDGRKVAEARKLVDTALRNYPELAAKKQEFLERQLAGINLQQAAKDFKIGEFYRRTGHPGSAYFYYEIVRRRYPGTPYFQMADERMREMRAKLEKSGQAPPPGAGAAAAAAPVVKPATPVAPQPAVEVAPPPRLLPDGAPGK